MRIITGDECGLLKETIPELSRPKQRDENLHSTKVQPSTEDGVRRIDSNDPQRRSRGVVDMAFTSSASFAALRANGSVQLWEGTHASKEEFGTYQCTAVVQNVVDTSCDNDEESTQDTAQIVQKRRPIALDAFTEKDRLCAADSLGNIVILKTNTSSPSVVATYSPFAKQVNQSLSYTKGSYRNTNIATAMAVDSRSGRVAIGGRERETTLLDIETGDVVWIAKNLPPDPQTLLQHPIWSTALLFLDASFGGTRSNHVMATGTAFKQVRLYDVRIDSKTRRPIAYTPEGLLSHRVTALCQADAHQIVVGDAAGFLHSLDMRTLGRQRKGDLNVGRFVGPAGSIRQVVKHDTLPIIAAVGLDRMLRTYHATKRTQLDCVYLKQRLNCVLFCQDDTWSPGQEENKNVTQDLDDGDLDAEDEVQDYVDSDNDSGESSGDDDSEEEEDSDAESADNDGISDDGESEASENESVDDAQDDEEELPRRPVSKKRRV